MGWTVSAIALVVFASGVVATLVGVFAFKKRPDPMAWPVTGLMIIIAVWGFADGLSMLNTSGQWLLFWSKIGEAGSFVAPFAYLVIGLQYAGYDRWTRPSVYAALGLVPAVSILFVLAYPATHLIWTDHEVRVVQETALLVTEFGTVYWVLLGLLYLVTAAGVVLFGVVAVRAGQIHKRQSLLMLAGGLAPLVINVAFNVGFSPIEAVDFTTTALTVSGVTFAAVLFRYDMLDLSPAAYRNVPDLFEDGVLVFDDEYRLVDANEFATDILDVDLEPRMAAADIFDGKPERIDGTVIERAGETAQFYSVRHAPLSNYQDDVVGHAVVMREITELKTHEQRLSVTNRILRHNLRNELNIVLGHASVLERRYPDETEIETIQRAAERMLATGEKAREMQASMESPGPTQSVAITSLVESVVSQYRDRYPAAVITVDGPEGIAVRTTDATTLESAIENVLENAIDHNDRDNPRVEISITPDGNRRPAGTGGGDNDTDEDGERGDVVVSIADDGPGIPPDEQRVLEQTQETQLSHGSGLGLWLVTWLVSAMNGSVEFEPNEPRGTVVRLRLQRADDEPEPATHSATPERPAGQDRESPDESTAGAARD